MEPLPEKLDRIVGDLDKVLELYEYAESLYPYRNLREPIFVILVVHNYLLS